MKNLKKYGVAFLFFYVIFFCTGVVSIYAQDIDGENVLNQKLEWLKNQYRWHSIYLSYSSIREVIAVLDKPDKREKINKDHTDEVVSSLYFQLKNCLNTEGISKSVGIVEIDLNRREIGSVRANSTNGEIDSFKLPDYWWFIRFALICHNVLAGIYRVQAFNKQVSNPEIASYISIKSGVNTLNSFHDDAYISTQNANIALFGLRTLIENNPQEFEKINQTDKKLYSNLSNFKSSFDAVLPKNELDNFKANKMFSEEYIQKLSEQPDVQKSTLNQNLDKSSAFLIETNKTKEIKSNPYSNFDSAFAGRSKNFNFLGTDSDSIVALNEYTRVLKLQGLRQLIFSGKLGEKIITEDYILTVVNIETARQISKSIKTVEGKTFLSVEIVIESKNDTGFNISPNYARIKDSNNYEYTDLSNGKEPSLKSQTNLPKGEKVRGWVTFELPENAKELTLIYQTLMPIPIRISINLGR